MVENEKSNEEGVSEAQLMHSLQGSRKQLIDCNKQSLVAVKANSPGKMSSDAGKINENKRENEDFVMDENLINMGLKPKISGNGPKVTQLQPTNVDGNIRLVPKGRRVQISNEYYWLKGFKIVNPFKPTQKQVQYHSPPTKLKLK